MRKIVLTIVVAGLPALALAEQSLPRTPGKAASPVKQLKARGMARSNPCTEYGAGFVKLEGSDSCMKIGGYVSSGASAYVGAR
jgi:hypothetical protein